MPMAPTTPVATTLPSCSVQQHELCTAHLHAQCAWYSLQLCKLVALLSLQTQCFVCPWGLDPLRPVPRAIPAVPG